jgi:periplasmic protein TonB
MLAYASHRRPHRRLSPTALTLIVGGHAAAIALLVTAKMDVSVLPTGPDTEIIDIPLPAPPPEPEPPQPVERQQAETPPAPDSFLDRPPPVLPLPQTGPSVDLGPPIGSSSPDIGPLLETPLKPALADPAPPADPVRVAARAITPPDLLRPPYPDSKRRSEEEAVLRLRLSIDERGRVTAVEPVGTADPAFLSAARSHLLRHWRYRPANEDGRPVASSLTITLRFLLEDE